MPLPTLTGEMRLVADPELKFSQNGKALCRVRLVANSSKKNEANEWVDDKTLWLSGTAFGKVAEHLAASASKGDILLVTGRLETQEWEKDGQKRSATALIINEVAMSLRFTELSKGETKTQTSAPAAGDVWGSQDSSAPPF